MSGESRVILETFPSNLPAHLISDFSQSFITEMGLRNLSLVLIDAIKDNCIGLLSKLVKDKNANPNVISNDGLAPMHYCIGYENPAFGLQALELFLAYGGDPNLPTPVEKYTPLHIACMNGRVEHAQVLIDNGADVYAVDAEENQPIFYAVSEAKCFDIVRIIKAKIYNDKVEKRRQEQQKSSNLLQVRLLF